MNDSVHQTVAEVMTPRIVAVTSVTFLPEAARIMKEEDVGSLPVVQEDGQLLGILTDRDIAVRAVAAGLPVDKTQVAEIYSNDPITVTPETTLADAEKMMADFQIRRLPIVSGGDRRLLGVISLADVSREGSRKEVTNVLQDVSQPGGCHTQVNENIDQ